MEDERAGWGGVVEVDAEGVLDLGGVQVVDVVFGWSGCVRVSIDILLWESVGRRRVRDGLRSLYGCRIS